MLHAYDIWNEYLPTIINIIDIIDIADIIDIIDIADIADIADITNNIIAKYLKKNPLFLL